MPVQDFVAAKLADEGRKSNGDSRVKASQFPSERWHAQGERGGRFSGRGVFTVGHTPSHSPLSIANPIAQRGMRCAMLLRAVTHYRSPNLSRRSEDAKLP